MIKNSFIKKYIGDKQFYKMVIIVALPIMIQNGITNFVSLLDNIMVGQIGTEHMSGVAIVNQLIFVFYLCIFGAVSGAGIFTSQFYGKGDVEGVRKTFRFKLIVCFIIGLISILVFVFLKEPLINLFLHDGSREGDLQQTLIFGIDYLNIMVIGLIPFAITQVYSGTMRETERAFFPMIAGFIAVITNCILNYILIFGKLGAPVLGVKGAAIATVISRFLEMFILIIGGFIRKERYTFIKGAFTKFFDIDLKLIKNIIAKGLPLLINETLWAVGMSALAQCYSVRGLAVVAGYNISSTVINVVNIAYMALGNAVGIIVGKYLGAKDIDKAIDYDRKMLAFAVVLGFVLGGILALTAKAIPELYNTTEEVKEIATLFMFAYAVSMPIASFLHSCYFTLRSGGKTIITFIYDSVFVICIQLVLVYCLIHFTSLSVIVIFSLNLTTEIIKCVIGAIMLKKRIWINTMV